MTARAGWLAIGLLVALPSLGVGFFGDDLRAVLVLEGRVVGARWTDAVGGPPAAIDSTQGTLTPWWAEEEAVARPWRPLTAASLALDHAVYGRDARGYHLTNGLLFALAVLLAAACFRELARGRRGIAVLAALVFALDEAHATAIAQPTARHALLGGALALGAWLTRRRPWASLGLLAMALGASELAAPVALWIAIDARLRGRSLRAAAPALALGLGAPLLTAALGRGELAPLEAGGALWVRLPVLAGALLAPVRPERLLEAEGGGMLAMGCALLVVLFAALARPALREPGARFSALALAAHLPWLALGPPSSVSLFLASVPAAYLVAATVRVYARGGVEARVLAGALLAVHLVLAPALVLRTTSRMAERVAWQERAAASIPRLPGARVLLLTSPADVDADLPLRVLLESPRPAGVWLMSLSLESHGLWHPDAGSIALSGELLRRPIERGMRAAAPRVGEVSRRGALEVTIEEVAPTHVARVAIRVDGTTPERLWLLARDGDRYAPVALPEETGAVTLPRADERARAQP